MFRSLGILAQVVVGGIAGFIAVQFFLDSTSPSPKPGPTDAEIERSFSELPDNAGAVYFAIKEYFPQDAALWREEIRRFMASAPGNRQQAAQQTYDFGASIRQRHAQSLRHASSADLNKVIAQQTGIVRPFRSEATLCNTLLMQGPMALSPEHRRRVVSQLGNTHVLYRSMYNAQKNPVERSEPTDAAWEALFDLYLAKGHTPEDIDLVVSPDQTDPRLCNAMLGFFDVVRSATFPGADAIKAELAVAMAGN